jgi:hypothetical protein
MKKIIALALVMVLLGVSVVNIQAAEHYHGSDAYTRDRVVKLIGQAGSCSGSQVRGKSGRVYILSAAHCVVLLSPDGMLMVEDESGHKTASLFVAISDTQDLMLLTPKDQQSLDVALSVHKHQHVHTMTHGAGMPAYRTDGELLGTMPIMVYTMGLNTYEITTAASVPGSSGGCTLDENNDLIGVVSNGNGHTTGLVPLSEIRKFLADF